jgi:glycerol-3-phosphate acyltransferase PlsY
MTYTKILEICLIAYLMGSIPFGFLLVHFFRKQDIRAVGSGNIGATNVLRSGGKGLGALTFLLDALKGFAAVWMARSLAQDYADPHMLPMGSFNLFDAVAIAGLCAMLGHIYPVWLKFKGGKGVATGFGVFVALAPYAALASLVLFILVFAIWRYVSLASIVSAAAFPLLVLTLAPPHNLPIIYLLVVFVVPFIIIVKHRENIGRLVNGTEYRFGKKKVVAE